MVNLTTLAPEIVAAILDETVPPDLTLFDLAVDPLVLWGGNGDASIGRANAERTYRRQLT